MNDFFKNPVIVEDMNTIYEFRESWNNIKHTSFYITGATGMLASYFVYFLIYLNEKYYYGITIYATVRNIEKATVKFGKYIEKDYFHLVKEDILLPVSLEEKVDYIIHAASLASPQYYGGFPVETMLPNIVATNELCKYGVKSNVKSFLFFSSGAVYGKVTGYSDIEEDNASGFFDFLADGSVYPESKRCGELICKSYCREYGLKAKSVRIHHTYGPTMDIANDNRAFSEFIRNILANENIVLKSPGLEKRAFCYITDAITSFYAILLDGKDGESYNIGNPNEFVTIRELAERLIGLFPEKGLTVEFQNRDDIGYCSLANTSDVPFSIKKMRTLGWEPKISIEDGFKRTIQFLGTCNENL